MATTRAHIVLPTDLLVKVDELVGPRERSAYIAEAVADRVQRDKLLAFIKNVPPIPDSAWDPELIRLGSARWVRKLRREGWPRPSHRIARGKPTSKLK
jgi:hypothetical protein